MSRFFWYDVMTGDVAAAQSFYQNVVGWTVAPAEIGEDPYTVFSAGDVGVAGLMLIPDEVPKKLGSFWSGYIYAGDVDAYAEKIISAGGTIIREPWDLTGVGRLLVAADPQGAKFVLMRPSNTQERRHFALDTDGHIGWHELHSSDAQQAFDFYAEVFGWKKTDAYEMGPLGTYQVFATDQEAIGGMVTLHSSHALSDQSMWLFYFNVADIHAATARIRANNGTVVVEPREVPGGRWVMRGKDPQGASFGLASSINIQ